MMLEDGEMADAILKTGCALSALIWMALGLVTVVVAAGFENGPNGVLAAVAILTAHVAIYNICVSRIRAKTGDEKAKLSKPVSWGLRVVAVAACYLFIGSTTAAVEAVATVTTFAIGNVAARVVEAEPRLVEGDV